MSGIPKTTSRLNDLGLRICLYALLRFITAKEYKTQSAKGKGAGGEVQRQPGTRFQEFCSKGVTQDTFNFSSNKL